MSQYDFDVALARRDFSDRWHVPDDFSRDVVTDYLEYYQGAVMDGTDAFLGAVRVAQDPGSALESDVEAAQTLLSDPGRMSEIFDAKQQCAEAAGKAIRFWSEYTEIYPGQSFDDLSKDGQETFLFLSEKYLFATQAAIPGKSQVEDTARKLCSGDLAELWSYRDQCETAADQYREIAEAEAEAKRAYELLPNSDVHKQRFMIGHGADAGSQHGLASGEPVYSCDMASAWAQYRIGAHAGQRQLGNDGYLAGRFASPEDRGAVAAPEMRHLGVSVLACDGFRLSMEWAAVPGMDTLVRPGAVAQRMCERSGADQRNVYVLMSMFHNVACDRAYDVYKTAMERDVLPGACHARGCAVEQKPDFVDRTLYFQGMSHDAAVASQSGPADKGAQELTAWNVDDGDKYQASSKLGLNFQSFESADRLTAHEPRNPEHYMDALRSRLEHAKALRFVMAVSAPLDRQNFTAETLAENGLCCAGTQVHLNGEAFEPQPADVMAARRFMGHEIVRQACHAMYGYDDRYMGPRQKACGMFEPPAFEYGDMFKNPETGRAVFPMRIDRLQEFIGSTEKVISDETKARARLKAGGRPMPMGVELTSDSGETRSYGIATEAFMERFLADTYGHEKFFERLHAFEFSEPDAQPTMRLTGDYDRRMAEAILASAGKPRRETGETAHALDADSLVAEARGTVGIPEKQAGRSRRGALDGKAAEIEGRMDHDREDATSFGE